MVGIKYGSYKKIEREIFPNLINFECTKIIEYNISVNETREVRFKVGGRNDDKKREIKFILNNQNILLSQTDWKAENEWILKVKITGKIEGNTNIQIKVENIILNTIKIKCINYKDVFSEYEINKLIKENEKSIEKHTPCIISADRQLGVLLNNKIDFITDNSKNNADVNTAYTRIYQINQKGYIFKEKIFEASTFKGKGYYKPIEYSNNKNIVSDFLNSSMINKLGFHVYYFTILNGYHVLLLVINNLNLCNKTFKVYDQIKDRGDYLPFSQIDQFFLDMNINNWEGAANLTKDKTASTKFGIWKIQKK